MFSLISRRVQGCGCPPYNGARIPFDRESPSHRLWRRWAGLRALLQMGPQGLNHPCSLGNWATECHNLSGRAFSVPCVLRLYFFLGWHPTAGYGSARVHSRQDG